MSATCSSLNLRKDCDVLQRSTLAAPDAPIRWAYRCHMDFSLLTFSGVLEGVRANRVSSLPYALPDVLEPRSWLQR